MGYPVTSADRTRTPLVDVHAHFLTGHYVRAAKDAGILHPDGGPGWLTWGAARHPPGAGSPSGRGSRGRRVILATPANDSWCHLTAAKSAGPRSGALLPVPAAWRAACSQ